MKKKLLAIAFMALSFILIGNHEVNAQDETRGFNKGKIVPQLGIGLGNYGYYYSGTLYRGNRFILPLIFGIEGGVHDYVGVGGYFGFGTRRYNDKTRRVTLLSTGAKGTFHFYNMIEDLTGANLFTDKLDIYVGVVLGYERDIYSHESDRHRFFGGGLLGVRYYPTSVVGVYLEVGRNVLSVVNLGVAFRLGKKN